MTVCSPVDQFRLNLVPPINPEKEEKLLQFLDNPIDSRLEDLDRKDAAIKPEARRLLGIIHKRESTEYVNRNWEERMARMCKNSIELTKTGASASLPSLLQRTIKPRGDQLNCLSVEEIIDSRQRTVQGPKPQFKKIPDYRTLPKGILERGSSSKIRRFV